VRVLVVRIQAHEMSGMAPRGVGFAARQQGERRLVEHGGRRTGDVTALVLEPVFEARARPERHAVEKLVPEAGQRGRFHP
jgi:hypothetical protein